MAKYEPTRSGKSMDDIAALMAAKTLERRGEAAREALDNDTLNRDQNEDQNNDTVTEDEAETADLTASDGVEDDVHADEADDTEVGTVGDDDEPTDGEASDDDDEVQHHTDDLDFELADDTLIELDDGKEISFKDLKSIYYADETITARVAEHDELANEAHQVRTKAIDDAQKVSAMMQSVYSHIDGVVTQPLISKPDEALKTTNPEQYIRHMDAYEQDQQRIVASKQQLEGAMTEFMSKQKEITEQRQVEAIRRLHREVPQLSNPETKDQAAQDILDAAKHYDFSPEEVQTAGDHRLYKMAYDAAQYRKLMAGQQSTIEDIKDQATTETKRVRTLRSRGTAAASRQTAQARKVRSLRSTAKKSGRVDDVAALLAAKHS